MNKTYWMVKNLSLFNFQNFKPQSCHGRWSRFIALESSTKANGLLTYSIYVECDGLVSNIFYVGIGFRIFYVSLMKQTDGPPDVKLLLTIWLPQRRRALNGITLRQHSQMLRYNKVPFTRALLLGDRSSGSNIESWA